jgi:hypothetical protein
MVLVLAMMLVLAMVLVVVVDCFQTQLFSHV